MNITRGFEWATHQPLIKAVLDLYDPAFVLELGVGIYSTPLFKGRNAMFVENNKEWANKMSSELGIDVIHHELNGITEEHGVRDMTEQQELEVIWFYDALEIPDVKPRLLFVDHLPAIRSLSINFLRSQFDLIIYHDADEAGNLVNQYHLIDKYGFNCYYLKTNMTGACLMIRQEIDKGNLHEVIQPYIRMFMSEWDTCTKMEL